MMTIKLDDKRVNKLISKKKVKKLTDRKSVAIEIDK